MSDNEKQVADKSGEKTASGLAGGVQHIFDTQKWVITAFSGVAAALVAGSQLSEIGKLKSWSWRFDIAIAGIALGVLGVGSIIWQAITVLSSDSSNLGSLAKAEFRYYRRLGAVPPGVTGKAPKPIKIWQVRRQTLKLLAKVLPPPHVELVLEAPYLFEGQALSFGHLLEKLNAQIAKRQAALADWKLTDLARRASIMARTQRIALLKLHQDRLVREAIFATVLGRFRRSRGWIFGGALTAGLGIALFAWAAHPPDRPSPTAHGVTSRIALSDDGKAQLATLMGGVTCVSDEMEIVVDDGGVTGIVVAAAPCTPVRVDIDGLGRLER